jgi:hypothetical protein
VDYCKKSRQIYCKSQDKFSPKFSPENKSLAAMLVSHGMMSTQIDTQKD